MSNSFYVEVPSLRPFQAPLYHAMDQPGHILNGAGLVYLPHAGQRVVIRKPEHGFLSGMHFQVLYPAIYLVLAELPPQAPPTHWELVQKELYGLGLAVTAIVLAGVAIPTTPVWGTIAAIGIAAGALQGANAVFRTCNAIFCPDTNELVDESDAYWAYRDAMYCLDLASVGTGAGMAGKAVHAARDLVHFAQPGTRISAADMDSVLGKLTPQEVTELTEQYRHLSLAGKIPGADHAKIDAALKKMQAVFSANKYLRRNMPVDLLRSAAKNQLKQAFGPGSALTLFQSGVSLDHQGASLNDGGFIGHQTITPAEFQAEVTWDDAHNTVTIRSAKYGKQATFYWSVWQQNPR